MKGEIENLTPLARPWNPSAVADPVVVEALAKVRRHLFVSQDQAIEAAEPIVVATMTEALRPQPTDRVLEVGAGSGYQTAVLAEIVDRVFAVEKDPGRAEETRRRLLKDLGYRNIELRNADDYDGWVEKAPFDSILVTEPAGDIPASLLDQVKDRGRMVIPIGTPAGPLELILVKKNGKTITTRSLAPARFVSIHHG
jgi:protein-L-isoaspartate(D-aspartate) O-methyltransferase